MSEKFHLERCAVSEIGSCDFCTRPHEEVIQINGFNGFIYKSVKLCLRCISDLNFKATRSTWGDEFKIDADNTHPATWVVGINPNEDTVGWWYNARKKSFTVRDCKSRDEMRELKSDIEYKHTEFYVVDNGDDMGNLILKKHTKAWTELQNAQ